MNVQGFSLNGTNCKLPILVKWEDFLPRLYKLKKFGIAENFSVYPTFIKDHNFVNRVL